MAKKNWVLALAAVAGGVMRLIEPLTERAVHGAALGASYALTDIFLILGFIGFGMAAGWLGKTGAAIGIVGLLFIRAGALITAPLYQPGAALALFGAAFVGIDILRRGADSRIAAVLFIAALMIGLAALIPQIAMPAAFAAGMAFGLGFAIQGVVLTRR